MMKKYAVLSEGETMVVFDDNENQQNDAGFVCDTPEKADWAIEKIKEERERRDLFISVAEKKIAQLEEQIQNQKELCDNKTGYLLSQLDAYLDTAPSKKTKTQISIELPAGKVVRKLERTDFSKNEPNLLKYLEKEFPDMISWTPKIKWSEFKKLLQISGESVIRTDTGEIIDPECISVQIVSSTVDVK